MYMLCSLEDFNIWFSKQKFMFYIIKYKVKVVFLKELCVYLLILLFNDYEGYYLIIIFRI